MSEPWAVGERKRKGLSLPSPVPTSFLGSAGSSLISETIFQVPVLAASRSFQPERSLPTSDFPPSAASAAKDFAAKIAETRATMRAGLVLVGMVGDCSGKAGRAQECEKCEFLRPVGRREVFAQLELWI